MNLESGLPPQTLECPYLRLLRNREIRVLEQIRQRTSDGDDSNLKIDNAVRRILTGRSHLIKSRAAHTQQVSERQVISAPGNRPLFKVLGIIRLLDRSLNKSMTYCEARFGKDARLANECARFFSRQIQECCEGHLRCRNDGD
jgi:hypothetical protein